MTVVEAARGYIGARWRHRGRNHSGIDCVGLVVLSLRSAGIQVDDQRGYGREPWNDRLRQELIRQFGSPAEQWSPGDIALFTVMGSEPRHVGILADHKYGWSLIHAANMHGVVEQQLPIKNINLIEVYPCRR